MVLASVLMSRWYPEPPQGCVLRESSTKKVWLCTEFHLSVAVLVTSSQA